MKKEGLVIVGAILLGSIVGGAIGFGAASEKEAEAVEVEVSRTPQACLDALDYAEEFAEITVDYSDVMLRWPPLVTEALTAGFDVSAIDAITEKIKAITADVEEVTGRIETLSPKMNAAKEECRGHAEA